MRPTKELFQAWSRYRDGTQTWQEFQQVMAPIRRTVDSLLLRGHGTAVDGMCRELYGHRECLWTFLEVQGVEPTNNAAERRRNFADCVKLDIPGNWLNPTVLQFLTISA